MYVGRMRLKNRREKTIRNDMEFKLELDEGSSTEILSSYDRISGLVHLINKSSPQRAIEVQDVSVWLEGTVTTRFRANNADQMQHVRFLPDLKKVTDLSQVTFSVIGRDDPKEKKNLPLGCHTFPFELQLTGEILPCSFVEKFARIQYRLVLHISMHWDTQLHFAKSIVMTTKGCYNLNTDLSLSSPQVITKRKEKSFFSTGPILAAHLSLSQKGFLPGETIEFSMNIENPSCQQIGKLVVSLVQKNVYHVQKLTKKTTTGILGTAEFPCDTNLGEIHWKGGSIPIPKNLMPTFTRENKKSVEILYLLQFSVETEDPPEFKGETIIIIGTTREPIPLVGGGNFAGATNFRSDHPSSLPSYSALSSRRSSLETLPPPYEEIFGDEDGWGDG